MEGENTGAIASESPIESEVESSEVESQESAQPEIKSAEQKAEAALKDPSTTKVEKKAIEKQLKKFKLKVDGREEEMELDISNEEELKKHLQLSKVSQKRMAEQAKLQKDVEQFINLLKSNPRKVLTDPNIGVDLKKFAQEIINEQLEEESLTEEQKEIKKLKADLQARMEQEENDKKTREQLEIERLNKEAEINAENMVVNALESSGLPKTPYTVAKMAQVMYVAAQNDIELPPNELASLVKTQMEKEIREMFAAAPDDVLEAMLGQENLNRLQKRRVAKAKAAPSGAASVKPVANPNKPKDEPTKQTMKDFFKF